MQPVLTPMITRLASLLILLSYSAVSQDSAFTRFADEVTFYNLFVRGKIDTLKVNAENQIKYRSRLDEVFREFVLHPESHLFHRLVRSQNEPCLKFVNGNNMFEVEVDSIDCASQIFLVYGYQFAEKRNYMVKDFSTQKIVWEGNGTTNYVQLIGKLDSLHYLIVEKTSDLRMSREAFVVNSAREKWKMIKGFEGRVYSWDAEGQATMKFVKLRERLILSYSFDTMLGYGLKKNDVLFNPAAKTLSYHLLLDNNKTQLVSAAWKNGVFLIDDYIPEDRGGHPVVPEP